MKTTEDLAKRVVRSKHWRWMPGMRNGLDGSRYMGVGRWARAWDDAYLHNTRKGSWPDLDASATIGGRLELVLLAYGDTEFRMTYSPSNGWWCVYTGEVPERQTHMGLSQAAVLVAALRAAP